MQRAPLPFDTALESLPRLVICIFHCHPGQICGSATQLSVAKLLLKREWSEFRHSMQRSWSTSVGGNRHAKVAQARGYRGNPAVVCHIAECAKVSFGIGCVVQNVEQRNRTPADSRYSDVKA